MSIRSKKISFITILMACLFCFSLSFAMIARISAKAEAKEIAVGQWEGVRIDNAMKEHNPNDFAYGREITAAFDTYVFENEIEIVYTPPVVEEEDDDLEPETLDEGEGDSEDPVPTTPPQLVDIKTFTDPQYVGMEEGWRFSQRFNEGVLFFNPVLNKAFFVSNSMMAAFRGSIEGLDARFNGLAWPVGDAFLGNDGKVYQNWFTGYSVVEADGTNARFALNKNIVNKDDESNTFFYSLTDGLEATGDRLHERDIKIANHGAYPNMKTIDLFTYNTGDRYSSAFRPAAMCINDFFDPLSIYGRDSSTGTGYMLRQDGAHATLHGFLGGMYKAALQLEETEFYLSSGASGLPVLGGIYGQFWHDSKTEDGEKLAIKELSGAEHYGQKLNIVGSVSGDDGRNSWAIPAFIYNTFSINVGPFARTITDGWGWRRGLPITPTFTKVEMAEGNETPLPGTNIKTGSYYLWNTSAGYMYLNTMYWVGSSNVKSISAGYVSGRHAATLDGATPKEVRLVNSFTGLTQKYFAESNPGKISAKAVFGGNSSDGVSEELKYTLVTPSISKYVTVDSDGTLHFTSELAAEQVVEGIIKVEGAISGRFTYYHVDFVKTPTYIDEVKINYTAAEKSYNIGDETTPEYAVRLNSGQSLSDRVETIPANNTESISFSLVEGSAFNGATVDPENGTVTIPNTYKFGAAKVAIKYQTFEDDKVVDAIKEVQVYVMPSEFYNPRRATDDGISASALYNAGYRNLTFGKDDDRYSITTVRGKVFESFARCYIETSLLGYDLNIGNAYPHGWWSTLDYRHGYLIYGTRTNYDGFTGAPDAYINAAWDFIMVMSPSDLNAGIPKSYAYLGAALGDIKAETPFYSILEVLADEELTNEEKTAAVNAIHAKDGGGNNNRALSRNGYGYPISNPFVVNGNVYQNFSRGLLTYGEWAGPAGSTSYTDITATSHDIVGYRDDWDNVRFIEGVNYDAKNNRFVVPMTNVEKGPYQTKAFTALVDHALVARGADNKVDLKSYIILNEFKNKDENYDWDIPTAATWAVETAGCSIDVTGSDDTFEATLTVPANFTGEVVIKATLTGFNGLVSTIKVIVLNQADYDKMNTFATTYADIIFMTGNNVDMTQLTKIGEAKTAFEALGIAEAAEYLGIADEKYGEGEGKYANLFDELYAIADGYMSELNGFKTAHKATYEISVDDVKLADASKVAAALTDFIDLPNPVKASLSAEKALLDALQNRITSYNNAIDKFKDDHRTIYNRTVNSVVASDLTLLNNARADFNTLHSEVKGALEAYMAKINSLENSINAAVAVQQAKNDANAFLTDHVDVLAMNVATVKLTDKDSIKAAKDALDALSAAAKEYLNADDIEKINSLYAKIQELENETSGGGCGTIAVPSSGVSGGGIAGMTLLIGAMMAIMAIILKRKSVKVK